MQVSEPTSCTLPRWTKTKCAGPTGTDARNPLPKRVSLECCLSRWLLHKPLPEGSGGRQTLECGPKRPAVPFLRRPWRGWCGALPPPRGYATATARCDTRSGSFPTWEARRLSCFTRASSRSCWGELPAARRRGASSSSVLDAATSGD
jgi:hypothetical protein